MKYKEVKIEMILVVNSEEWDELFTGVLACSLEDILGDQQVEGIEGVAGARELGSRDLGDDPYDEYPLLDDGEVWNNWEK